MKITNTLEIIDKCQIVRFWLIPRLKAIRFEILHAIDILTLIYIFGIVSLDICPIRKFQNVGYSAEQALYSDRHCPQAPRGKSSEVVQLARQ